MKGIALLGCGGILAVCGLPVLGAVVAVLGVGELGRRWLP